MKEIKLDLIRLDSGAQARAKLDEDVVAQYAEALTARAAFPPPVVYFDGTDHWLAEGFHRVHANLKIGAVSMEVEVRLGNKRDAVLFGVGANQDHGLQRNNADKRKAAEILLMDEEWGKWSDREVARRVGVGHTFIARVRAEISMESDSIEPQKRTFSTKHGTEAQRTVKPRAAAKPATTMATSIRVPAPAAATVPLPAASVQLKPGADVELAPGPAPSFTPASVAEADLQQKYDDLRERSLELARMLEETSADNARMSLVIDADDQLKAALERIKQLEALVDVMEGRNGGLMAEKNEAIKAAKRWQRKAEGK
jgi:hypothetical protein